MTEATPDSLRALAYYDLKGSEFENMVDEFVEDVEAAKAVMVRGYDFNIHDSGTKEDYNAMREHIQAAEYNKAQAQRDARERKAAERQERKAAKALEDAALTFKSAEFQTYQNTQNSELWRRN